MQMSARVAIVKSAQILIFNSELTIIPTLKLVVLACMADQEYSAFPLVNVSLILASTLLLYSLKFAFLRPVLVLRILTVLETFWDLIAQRTALLVILSVLTKTVLYFCLIKQLALIINSASQLTARRILL